MEGLIHKIQYTGCPRSAVTGNYTTSLCHANILGSGNPADITYEELHTCFIHAGMGNENSSPVNFRQMFFKIIQQPLETLLERTVSFLFHSQRTSMIYFDDRMDFYYTPGNCL